MKKGSVGSIRHKISSPVELIHTTNILSYNAPDINPKTASSTGSHRSDDDMSDSHTTGSTPPTSPDVESSPKRSLIPQRSLSPEPNHLSSYFTVPGQTAGPPPVQPEAPVVPQRAASHSKKTYNTLVRQRSASALSEQSQRTVSSKASLTFSRSSSTSTSTSQSATSQHHKAKLSSGAAASPNPSFPVRSSSRSHRVPQQQQHQQHRKDYSESQHPFGPELAQVSEIAEEFGIKEHINVVDEEAQFMLDKGLLKFSAEDYLGDIRDMFATFFFAQPDPTPAGGWI